MNICGSKNNKNDKNTQNRSISCSSNDAHNNFIQSILRNDAKGKTLEIDSEDIKYNNGDKYIKSLTIVGTKNLNLKNNNLNLLKINPNNFNEYIFRW